MLGHAERAEEPHWMTFLGWGLWASRSQLEPASNFPCPVAPTTSLPSRIAINCVVVPSLNNRATHTTADTRHTSRDRSIASRSFRICLGAVLPRLS